jgi:hypothetical protein
MAQMYTDKLFKNQYNPFDAVEKIIHLSISHEKQLMTAK